MGAVEAFLVKYPELAVYLTIALGYLIGRHQRGRHQLRPGDRARCSPGC